MKYAHGSQSALEARSRHLEELRWKPYEIDIIKNNYKQFSDQEIHKQLLPHRTATAVTSKRQEIGCYKLVQKHQKWTPEEIKLLKDNFLDYDQRQLQAKFFPNKTVEQVRSAKMSRGLKKPPVWTNEQRGLLLDHGASYTQTELQKKFFSDKSLQQIAGMRKHLGIKRRNEK